MQLSELADLMALIIHDGGVRAGMISLAQAGPCPSLPVSCAVNLVDVLVGQLALPFQESLELVQEAGVEGLATGPEVTVPLVRVTVRLHDEVIPSRLAVIRQNGIP